MNWWHTREAVNLLLKVADLRSLGSFKGGFRGSVGLRGFGWFKEGLLWRSVGFRGLGVRLCWLV